MCSSDLITLKHQNSSVIFCIISTAHLTWHIWFWQSPKRLVLVGISVYTIIRPSNLFCGLCLACLQITTYVSCVVWIPSLALGSQGFCAAVFRKSVISARFHEPPVHYPVSVRLECFHAFLCLLRPYICCSTSI